MKKVLIVVLLLVLLAGCGEQPDPIQPPSPLAVPVLKEAASPYSTGVAMDLGSIGMVEIAFLVVGLTQMICYFVNKKDQPETIDGKGKVAVAILVGLPFLALREAMGAGYVAGEAANVVIMVVRGIADLLAIPGLVGFAKQNFSR